MTASVTDSSRRATHHAEHEIVIDAPARDVYGLLADVQKWPLMFDLTVHGEIVERNGQDEQIRVWSATNDAARTWTSRRHHDPDALTIGFRPDKTKAPIGGMNGTWVVEPLTDNTCRLLILHDFFPATDDPADLDWINNALDRNTGVELAKVKARAESLDSPLLVTFADTVEVDGSATDVYDFLNEAQLWKERLSHVSRVSLEEDMPGLQILEMDTRTQDGSVHTTRSIRVCEPNKKIIHKQTVLPALMTLHTGRWLIEEHAPDRVSATSEHTVRINTSNITSVLGEDADLAAAQTFVRDSLSENSLATLELAKAYAENAAGRGGQ
ncbi:MAG: aromatase/cyclase [Actinoallomurus sp.]